MNLLFLNIGGLEVILLAIVFFLIVVAIGNYGRNTALGYWGSVLLAIFGTPLIAFIVILFLRNKKAA